MTRYGRARDLGQCLRTFDFESRAASDGRTLEGYAAVYNSPARIRDLQGDFDEVILPGAFTRSLSRRMPVMQWEHGRDPRVGAVPIASIEEINPEDRKGLYVRARLMDDPLVEPIRKAIAAKTVKGMSFRFEVPTNPQGDTWTRRTDDVDLREIRDADTHEIGPVVFPAYDSTSVSVRSILASFGPDERRALVRELAAEVRLAVDLSTLDDPDEEDPWTPTTTRVQPAPSRVAVRAAEERSAYRLPSWASYGDPPREMVAVALRLDVPVVAVDDHGEPCWQVFTRAALNPIFNEENHALPVVLGHALAADGSRSEVLRTALGEVRRIVETRSGLVKVHCALLDTALVDQVVEAIRTGVLPGMSIRALVEDSRRIPDRKLAPNGRDVWPVFEITRAHLVETGPAADPADPEARILTIDGKPVGRQLVEDWPMSVLEAMEVASAAAGRPGEGQLRTELRGIERELDERARVSRARAFRHRGKPAAAERYARGMTDSEARARLVEIRRDLDVYQLLAG